MKKLNSYITEKLNLSKHTYKSKDKGELKKIIIRRLKKDKDANLNDIDVSDITDMSFLFYGFDPHNIDISEWDVSNVKSMNFMFGGCENFNSDISEWNVSNVKTMYFMFSDCKKFNQNISKWNVSNVEDMEFMFDGCTSLKNKPWWYKN